MSAKGTDGRHEGIKKPGKYTHPEAPTPIFLGFPKFKRSGGGRKGFDVL